MQEHTDSGTNLPYSSLVTLGKINKQGFEKRENMKGNSNSEEYIKAKCKEEKFSWFTCVVLRIEP